MNQECRIPVVHDEKCLPVHGCLVRPLGADEISRSLKWALTNGDTQRTKQ